jgi:hypothetical protein
LVHQNVDGELSQLQTLEQEQPSWENPTPCLLGLSATSQQYFSLRTNQPPATSRNQPAVLFSQNKPAPAISHQPTEQAASLSDLKELKVSPNALTSEVHLGHLESRSMVAMPELLQSPPYVPL